jgi:hypothetical protein
MRWPYTAKLFKMFSDFGMPIPRHKNRQFLLLKKLDVPVKIRDDLVTAVDAQSSTGTKIILDVNHQESLHMHNISVPLDIRLLKHVGLIRGA